MRPRTIAALALLSIAAHAQDYPNKPIRILTGAPGGGGDFAARVIAQGLSAPLGQQIVVDNRGGVIPIEIAAKSPPDGYTLVLDGASLWLEPLLRATSYDAVRDFTPVMLAFRSPNVLIVHASVAATSVRELVAAAKARPGELNYSSGSIGTTAHLAAELFKSMAGIEALHVKYKGTGPAVNALLGNEVQFTFATPAVVLPHVAAGRVRALGVTSAQPTALAPGLAPLAATLPGYEAVSLYALFAPARTPPAIVNRLNREIGQVLQQPAAQSRLAAIGLEAIAAAPRESAQTIAAEIAKWGRLIRDAGVRAE